MATLFRVFCITSWFVEPFSPASNKSEKSREMWGASGGKDVDDGSESSFGVRIEREVVCT